MKKVFLLFCLAITIQSLTPSIIHAQSGGKSLLQDILAAMPVQNKQQLERNMQAISALGESGITQLAGSLKPERNGDNTAAEYAISSYSFYVMQPSMAEQRKIAARAYIAALPLLQDNVTKQFIIKQLQQIGDGNAVQALKNYLSDEVLSGPAARALAQINTPSSAEALLMALSSAKGGKLLSIVEALGNVGYKPAVNAIVAVVAASTDVALTKVGLYALASIGSPAATTTLQKAAQKAGYTYDNSNAVSAYILYLHKLAVNGNTLEASALANQLLKSAGDAGQLHTKLAALQLITEVKGSASLPLLRSALFDKDVKYRGSALFFAAKFQSPASDKEWLALIPALAPAAQVQVVDFLGQTGDASLLLGIQKLLKHNNIAVKIAAIGASGKIGGKAALPVLLEVLKLGDTLEVAAAKAALLTLKSNDIVAPIVKALPGMPAQAKVALLQVLAARSASAASHEVFAEVGSKDSAVHHAAVQALAALVTKEDLPKLFKLLNDAKAVDVTYLQQSIINALGEIKDTAHRVNLIISAMDKNKAQDLYLYLLASTGESKAFDLIRFAYEEGEPQTKTAAIAALTTIKSTKAARTLLLIAQQNNGKYSQAALNGYLGIIQQSPIPADQKLLMLQEAITLASNDEQRNEIIREAGECHTFLAMVFAGKYLDYPPVQQAAAHAVMDIALSNNDFSGDIVVSLLNKTIAILSGQDADYEKQAIKKHMADITDKPGFTAMFNGTDLTGWRGLVENPIARAKMNPDTLAAAQLKADKIAQDGWFAKDGLLVFSGHGENLCTVKQYGDFEMFVDWKITKEGDAGIYLRGSPQVQIWDTSRISVGAQVGSGGLYNNQKYQSKPLVLADNAIGEWNSFHIIMRGEKVTVYLNGVLVTDNVVLENYWDRSLPIFVKEQIELQAHGTYVAYRNMYIKELTGSPSFALSNEEKKDGFTVLFDGSNLDQWTGNTVGYKVDQGSILVDTADGHPGNLYTKQQYSDFVLRFEFQLTPGANNGIGIRAPLEGDAAYVGMEIQVQDNEADMYKDLHVYQYHGSVYGVIPAKRGFLKPTGEWNYEEITAQGPHIKVVLNGEVILDGNIDEASKDGTADKREHPGLHNPAGHIGFLGHGSVVRFRNLRVKEL